MQKRFEVAKELNLKPAAISVGEKKSKKYSLNSIDLFRFIV